MQNTLSFLNLDQWVKIYILTCLFWLPQLTDSTVVDTPRVETCLETVARRIRSSVDRQIRECIDDHVRGLEEHYLSVCANPDSLDDVLFLQYPLHYYHFTLYYYDRSGAFHNVAKGPNSARAEGCMIATS